MRVAGISFLLFGGSIPGLALSVDFLTGVNTQLVSGTGGVAGLAQKLDNTFQSFPGGVLRKTDRGAIVEPASQNFIAASSNLPNAAWSVSSSFTAVVAKTSVIPGETAYEYESDTTGGFVNQANRGTFTSNREFLYAIIEAMPTATNVGIAMADSTAGNTEAIAMYFNCATKVVTQRGNAGSRVFGYLDFGPGSGPNGGNLFILHTSGIPAVPGNTRRMFVYCNGSGAGVAGRKIVFHHVQYEVQAWGTSPIVNPSTTSLTRAAEVVTIAVPTGTYDVRFTLQDGTIVDRYGVTSVANVMTIPTDVTQQHAIWVGDVFAQDIQRNGYITNIAIWNQKPNNIHALGDSYLVNSGSSPGQIVPKYLPSLLHRPRIWTFDGVGATSLTQQAVRFDSTSQYYGDLLIIMDGVIDGLVSNNDFANFVGPAIDSMVAHLTTSPKQWLYIQPNPDVNAGNIGSVYYTRWLLIQSQIKAVYPDHYVETLPQMQSRGNGSANDNADIAAGQWPRSLRISVGDVHPNELGSMYLAQITDNAVYNARL